MKATPLLPALLMATLLCAPARADRAAERDARALFVQGNQQIKEGNYAGALELFRSAYARFPSVKILLNIGTMLRQLGRNVEAADAYEAYLREPAAAPAKRLEVGKLLADLDARVSKLRVILDDRRATVRVDGKAKEQTGGLILLRIAPGPHGVSAEQQGMTPVLVNVTALAGQETEVKLHLEPAVPPLPVPASELAASIPVVPQEPHASVHAPSISARRTLGFASIGVGAAGLGLGAVTGVLALQKHGALTDACPDGHCREQTDAIRGLHTMETLSTAGFIGGAALAATGIVLFITTPKTQQANEPRIVPVLGAAYFGAKVRF
jgi:hypothetical protein